MNVIDGLLVFMNSECNRNYEKYFDGDLNKEFPNAYRFCKANIYKLILMLRKVFIHIKKKMIERKIKETHLCRQEDFYSNLSMENMTDVDHKHVKKVWKDFELYNLGEY